MIQTYSTKSKTSTAHQLLYYRAPDGRLLGSYDFGPFVTETLWGPKIKKIGGFCDHYKTPDIGMQLLAIDSGGAQWYGNGPEMCLMSSSLTWPIIEPLTRALNWEKLKTSSGFDLLVFLGEFDETIAMFGEQLLKQHHTYGGYQWGWLPLLNDVKAIADLLNKLKDWSPEGSPYHDTNKFTKIVTVGTPQTYPFFQHRWEVTQTYKGMIKYPFDILALFDVLGFHPSPSVIWDLIPLSFAVDWVLPVGDTLDALKGPKGWVQAANFTGWSMLKYICKCTMANPRSASRLYERGGQDEVFIRRGVRDIALTTQTFRKELGVKWPSFKNTLNLAYLSKTYWQPRLESLDNPFARRIAKLASAIK